MVYKKFIGTGVALITPFNEDGSIDFISLEKLIKLHKKYSNYLVVLGTTAESPTLTKEEKIEIIQFTVKNVQGEIPIVVGIGGNNTQQVINDIHTFPLKNIDAILSVSPYYNKPTQEGIYEHYKKISENTSKPIILYNVPGRTGKNISAETTIQLAKHCKNIIGIKEASGDFDQAMKIIKNKPKNFIVISGDDALALPLIACGMQGVISVIGNCFPIKFNQLIQLSLKNKFEAANKIQHQLLDAYSLIFEENNPAGIKFLMHQRGFIQNNLRLPLVTISKNVQDKIKSYLKNNHQLN